MLNAAFDLGHAHALRSHYFDPPCNLQPQDRDEYRSGYETGHSERVAKKTRRA